jgi:PAS domain-containing protein
VLSRYTKLVPANSPEAFGIALGSVAAATVVRFGLTPLLGDKAPYILMFPAVLTAALVGGTLPGVLALTLGLLSAWYFFVPPAWSLALRSVEDVTSLGLYVLTGLLLILIAVTVRRAVARVELAQEKLVAALDASGTGTWRWDIGRDVVEWDLAMCRVFGLDPAQAPSTAAAFFDLVHPDDRSHARRIIGDAVKQGERPNTSFVRPCRTGLKSGSMTAAGFFGMRMGGPSTWWGPASTSRSGSAPRSSSNFSFTN